MSRTSQIVLGLILTIIGFLLLGTVVVRSLQNKITTRLEKGWVLTPLELYSQGFPLAPGRKFPREAVEKELERRSLVQGRDFNFEAAEVCAEHTGVDMTPESTQCFWIRGEGVVVGYDDEGYIIDLFKGDPLAPAATFGLFPRLITQFFDNQPILQLNTPLSEFPLQCLQAVTAIEDKDFLEHKGVSATGTLRALMRNLKAGRFAEGGSTITQQLVKNFFLESKKTIKRKIEEQILAVLLESQIDKDQILEMYLNVIYMGQSGPYQVRGLGSAAQAVFDKPVSRLTLPECALLAAIINSPGRYSPTEHPEAARARRELVLKKMSEANMISSTELVEANATPLPKPTTAARRAHAPYFVLSALREFESLELYAENGARLYTTLDPEAQLAMTGAVASILPEIEKRVKKPSKEPLQVAALAIDVESAEILALVGGRDYRHTQFNRAIDSRRQIGSQVKPFVYYPALQEMNPLTAVSDTPFEWKNGNQTWKPRNYESKTFNADVPLFFSLALSMNVPTARVGQTVGLDAIADTLRRAGVTANIPLLPSLTLGALELSPFEVAQAYSTLARLGSSEKIHTLSRVEDSAGQILFEHQPSKSEALDPAQTAVLVGMLRQTLKIGTAKVAGLLGVTGDFAGKTGTTSDTKDAWFSGFNSRLLVVVWVGYDDNTVMGLTGASAALPVWASVIKGLQNIYRPAPFTWPTGVEVKEIPKIELEKAFPYLPPDLPESIELIFPAWAS